MSGEQNNSGEFTADDWLESGEMYVKHDLACKKMRELLKMLGVEREEMFSVLNSTMASCYCAGYLAAQKDVENIIKNMLGGNNGKG